ncbi:nuclease [Vibrio cholerae]|uniref:nuclease-related domain-containing protein n=1 Tax=Vibrio cholerae TaxID=666 RepID=UPI00155E6847|nr:nuclease-related domain-containing protein [Vibrio cholerae]MBJ6968847.1 NERD domain-containing protein [Vibrio cholerae]NOE38987.1 nuclease [Vibrio cholerae]NOF42470.1 NERD domain-containing protein [Vibrio cholerae]GHX45584.1 hypothetical protein VCSRO159_0089 [Vibrio cholerae]
MIVKEKTHIKTSNFKQDLGNQVENDVAFYLRRHFSENESIFIYNDLRIEHKGEIAQIDHLVVYKKGFIIIESKSIKGTVQINKQLEWQRTVRGKWVGMPSPITQAEMQTKLLKALLNDNAEQLLEKILMLQGYFGGRCWDTLCAASNDAIIDRDNIPSKISPMIIKSEQIANRVEEIIASRSSILKPNPTFSDNELKNIKNFLIEVHKNPLIEDKKFTNKINKPDNITHQTETKINISNPWFICKECSSNNTSPKYGKFGYYVICKDCNKNTSMNVACIKCGNRKTHVSKDKNTYTVSCECGHKVEYEYQSLEKTA